MFNQSPTRPEETDVDSLLGWLDRRVEQEHACKTIFKQSADMIRKFRLLARYETDVAESAIEEVRKHAWRPIADLPDHYTKSGVYPKPMVIVRALYPNSRSYSDPWCVWFEGGEVCSRWPHPFPPTEFCELPNNVAEAV